MNRKARQAAEREMRRQGAMQISWEHGQKHEIATVQLADGRYVDIVLRFGHTDDVFVRQLVKSRIRQAVEKSAPALGL